MNERRKYEVFKVNLLFSNLPSNLLLNPPSSLISTCNLVPHTEQERENSIPQHSTHKEEKKYSRMFSPSCSAVSNTEIKKCWNLNLNIFIACDRRNNKTNVTYNDSVICLFWVYYFKTNFVTQHSDCWLLTTNLTPWS